MSFRDFFIRYRWTILLVVLGVIFVVLIFTINFWRTLLVFLVLGLCALFGMLLDKDGSDGVKEFFRRIFRKN
ncbi:MAG: DUF2273 domain-containing protein [Clostridia bacterium]